ncbi:MAG: outer membrane beta-barrel protein, partial [Deltaproteobacteria bacterium]
GFVSTGYNYNFNEPHSRAINYRPFNNRSDSFTVETAELAFHQDASSAGTTGYMLDVYFGTTTPTAIASTGTNAADDIDIKQAYVSYVAGIGNGLKLDFGKFITEMGGEVIEGYSDWNYNYSRSLLFYYTIPYTHTGARGTYVLNDQITLIGQIINGWDNATDNNGGKAICAHVMITPAKDTMVNVKYMAGPEGAGNDMRQLLNLNASVTVLDKLVVKADYVYGYEENVSGIGDAQWTGLAGVVRYPLNDKLALNARAEVFSDTNGSRTGRVQRMKEITVTPEYALSANALVRVEFRHDKSNEQVFDRGGALASSNHQNTVGVNVLYHF